MLTRIEKVVDAWAYPVCNNPRQQFEICIQEDEWPVIFWLVMPRYFFSGVQLCLVFVNPSVSRPWTFGSLFPACHIGLSPMYVGRSRGLPIVAGCFVFFSLLHCYVYLVHCGGSVKGNVCFLGYVLFRSLQHSVYTVGVYMYRVIFLFHEHCEGT